MAGGNLASLKKTILPTPAVSAPVPVAAPVSASVLAPVFVDPSMQWHAPDLTVRNDNVKDSGGDYTNDWAPLTQGAVGNAERAALGYKPGDPLYDALQQKYANQSYSYSARDAEAGVPPPQDPFNEWLAAKGYQLQTRRTPGANTGEVRYIDAQGNLVGPSFNRHQSAENDFLLGGLALAAPALYPVIAGAGATGSAGAAGAAGGAGAAGATSGGLGAAGSSAFIPGVDSALSGYAFNAAVPSAVDLGSAGGLMSTAAGAAAPAAFIPGADSAASGYAFNAVAPSAVDLGSAGGLMGTAAGAAAPSLLGSLKNAANIAGKLAPIAKLVSGAVGSQGSSGGGSSSGYSYPAEMLTGTPSDTMRSYQGWNPSEIDRTFRPREGHTMGVSGAVNFNDPSAALFGYGPQHVYYRDVPAPGMADGGSVADWLGAIESFGGDSTVETPNVEESTRTTDILKSLAPSLFGGYGGGNGADNVSPDYSNPHDKLLARGEVTSPQGSSNFTDSALEWIKKLSKGDKETNQQYQLGLGALGLLHTLMRGNAPPPGYKSAAELQASLRSPYYNWTPQQQINADRYFGSTRAYAPAPVQGALPTARSGLVQGLARGGQADNVHVRLSPGEYVVDADVVSALGDGDNRAGASRLDDFRQSVREHKRSAPSSSIPPQAKPITDYLKD